MKTDTPQGDWVERFDKEFLGTPNLKLKAFIAREIEQARKDLWVDIHCEGCGRWYCVDFTEKGREGVQMFHKQMWHFHKPHSQRLEGLKVEGNERSRN